MTERNEGQAQRGQDQRKQSQGKQCQKKQSQGKQCQKKQPRLPPPSALELLKAPDCRKYIRFADGKTVLFPSLSSPDGQILALALEEEHTEAGRALLDALWFSHPVCVILDDGNRIQGYRMEVYRCHIAGPLFLKKLLEVRMEDPEKDMASAWELHFLEEEELTKEKRAALLGAAPADRAEIPEWHLDHPALHGQTGR